MRHALVPRYAGDKLKVVALRGEERIEREIELVADIPPYEFPFLGVLPLRDASGEPGVRARYVYPESPAAKAGMRISDRILAMNGKAVADRDALFEAMAAEVAGREIELELNSGEETKKLKLKLETLPEAIPSELPPAHGEIAPAEGERPATGLVTIKIPEIANECSAYVPDTYQTNVPHGVLLWLHAAGGYKEAELVEAWKEHCARHDLILLAPKSADPQAWQRSELAFIRKALDNVLSKYNIDRKRIAIAGIQGGGSMAYLFGFGNRELAAGVIAIEAPIPPGAQIPPTDPVQRQVFFVASAKKSAVAAQAQASIERLRALKHPVTVKDLGEDARPLTTEENAELARWLDALDRI
jgi:serine protease Do